MADDLIGKLGELLKKKPWYQLPRLLADGRLYRDAQRAAREEPPRHGGAAGAAAGDSVQPRSGAAVRHGRFDGTFNDLHFPKMGAAGRRFGRNFPLEHTFPDTPNLLIPNPRVVSRELMTRDTFKPATILNLLAGGVAPVHGARLVRAMPARRPTSSTSRRRPATTTASRACACREACPMRRPPDRRGRPPT